MPTRPSSRIRIVQAAADAGIGLTLLPVLYSYGGAGAQPLAGGQRRFGNDLDGFLRLREAARGGAGRRRGARRGAAFAARDHAGPDRGAGRGAAGGAAAHPRRRAGRRRWRRSTGLARGAAGGVPARRDRARPALVPDPRHADDRRSRPAASPRSGAVAGLCPITEANLGDGIFQGTAYLAAGGGFGVGGDSNVRISLAEELRGLEYSQRLTPPRPQRAGGARRLGRRRRSTAARWPAARRRWRATPARCAPGALADLVAIDRDHPALAALDAGQLLDGWIFAADDRVVREVWSAGRHVVTRRPPRRAATRSRRATAPPSPGYSRGSEARPPGRTESLFILRRSGPIYRYQFPTKTDPRALGAAEFSAAGAACSTKGATPWRFH